VTTESLRDRIKELFPEMPVYVNRNAVSDEMVRQADFALKRVSKVDDGSVRIIYMSGTRTHNEDFAQCVAALDRLLQAHSRVRLMIVGHLDLPERLHRWSDRLEVTPLIPWQELPKLMRRADINLAPLELENAFTDCKSELKYFESGLLELPTVASQVAAFQFAITPGQNGFLCRSEQDWFDAIERLVLSPELRRRIGSNARQDVLARYTTRSRAPELTKALRQIFDDLRITRSRRLSIAIVTRAPIAQTGGGYKNIFTLANRLADRGHDVHIYVETIAHLAGLTDSEIVAFCHRYFGSSTARVHVGHDQILPSDIALATNWPTAYTVNNLTTTKCKAYFIQDFEPDFYDRSDPEYERAEQTYELPLKKITLGKYLQTLFSKRDRVAVPQIPFSLDLSIFCNLRIRQQSPIRVLFFARPDLKRRAYPVGVEALRILAGACPEVEIAFYGMSEPEDLGFAYQNLGELSPEQVTREMNRSHIHLSFSLTNISWVPFEAMACGCSVVEAKVPSIEAWTEDETESCVLVEPNARAVADALIKLVRNPQMRDRVAARGEKYVAAISATWEESCEQLEKILLQAVFRDNAATEGTLIMSRTGGFGQKIFYIDGGKRRWIRDPQWAKARGYRLHEDIQLLSDDEIARLPLGGYIPSEWTAADRKLPPAYAPLREIVSSGLTGSGIEFGAGDNPFPVPIGCKVRYADRLSQDAFAMQYHSGEQIDAVTPELLTGLCEMEGVAEESLDFVIASHVLEHTPNPLLALRTAYSRLKPGGKLVLVVPDKRYTFDKERALTTLDHLVLDYNTPSSERDRQHWEEWYTKAFPVRPDQLDTSISAALCRNADIHYHTWTYKSFRKMVDYVCKKVVPWSAVWSHPRNTEEGIEFYFVLTK
jgi:glycosyltransferase involved in cell wall biosynthesis